MRGLEKILRAIKPKKKAERTEREFISRAIGKLRQELGGAKVVLAGSFAKGTFLEGDKDIDIFVLFSHNVEKEAMEGIVRAAVENAFPKAFFHIAYAQHPYVRVFLEGRKIDVVPAYEVSHGRHFELKSPVDRSVLHTSYILSKMSVKQKDGVRLLKKFLKANRLYGAEIRVQGFSGYLCELLILKYGTFAGAIRNIAQWKARTFIDLEKRVSEQEGLGKFETPLVVLDPVDRERNVSAVVSAENYFALVSLSRAFLKSKNKTSFFEKKKFTGAQLSTFAKHRHLYCISFASPKIVDDVLWGQVRRFYSTFASAMKKDGFEIIGHRMDRCNNNVCVLFELLNEPLAENKIVFGPPMEFSNDCGKFAAQYKKGLFIFEGRLAAGVKRKERTMEGFFRKIKKLPLPSHLSSVRNAKLYKGAKIIGKCRSVLEQYAASRLII